MLIYAHAPHGTRFREDSWLVLRSGFIISPTDLHTAIQGKTKICRGSLIFPFLEGRASAASGTKSPRGLVDVHHHENTGFLFQVSPWSEGMPKATALQRTTTSVTAAWGRATHATDAPVEETRPDYLPAEGFAPSKVCDDNGKCARRSCWLVCTL